MPDMNGFAAINALRRAVPGMGIVAYTGVAGSYVRSEMDRLGIEVVLKSGSIAPLLAALRRSIGVDPSESGGGAPADGDSLSAGDSGLE
jgi:DNA-binding NarL/FixJ family response regulator